MSSDSTTGVAGDRVDLGLSSGFGGKKASWNVSGRG